jgi:hypothetical protein
LRDGDVPVAFGADLIARETRASGNSERVPAADGLSLFGESGREAAARNEERQRQDCARQNFFPATMVHSLMTIFLPAIFLLDLIPAKKWRAEKSGFRFDPQKFQ